jgi:quinol monooxygenase YgiN
MGVQNQQNSAHDGRRLSSHQQRVSDPGTPPGGYRMLGVVATIKVKPGMESQFEAVAKELVAKVTANEPGCRLYVLHRGEAPQTYVFMERYADQAAVEAHAPPTISRRWAGRWASSWKAARRSSA